jgi:broad specificity phosphatase PhoE
MTTSEKPTFIIVRHGESATNLFRHLHTHVSDPQVWLSHKGHQQAHAAGEFLRTWLRNYKNARTFSGMHIPPKVRIMRSEYRRAVHTAEHIEVSLRKAQKRTRIFESLEVRDLGRLRELEFGHVGQYNKGETPKHEKWLENILRFQNFKFYARRAGGESPADVDTRVRLATNAMYRDFVENNVGVFVVVCHGLTMRVLIRVLMGYDNAWYNAEPNPDNCAIRVIQNGRDQGFVFPNARGQWNPDWLPEVNPDAHCNPDGLFLSVEHIEEAARMEQKYPGYTEVLYQALKAGAKADRAMEIATAWAGNIVA